MAKPFAHALDRMDARAVLRPDELEARAASLLEARFGPGDAPATAFARGGAGLISEHTHYYDGFALMLPLTQGTAVALRPARQGTSAVAIEGGTVETLGAEAEGPSQPGARVVREVLARRGAEPVEVAVVGSIPMCFQDARLSSLAVAVGRGLQKLAVEKPQDARRAVLGTLVEALQAALYPFSLAYLITAYEGEPGTYSLVDTHTHEHRPLAALPETQAAWGLFDPGRGRISGPRSLALQRRATRALAHLRDKGIGLGSFRYLEHRDLPAALDAADPAFRPTIQFLVTENRRVMNLVHAIVQGDTQKMGAVLRMSYLARREWEGSRAAEDAAHSVAEVMALDGVYGTALTGHGRSLLVLGRPAILPTALDKMADAVAVQTGQTASAMLL